MSNNKFIFGFIMYLWKFNRSFYEFVSSNNNFLYVSIFSPILLTLRARFFEILGWEISSGFPELPMHQGHCVGEFALLTFMGVIRCETVCRFGIRWMSVRLWQLLAVFLLIALSQKTKQNKTFPTLYSVSYAFKTKLITRLKCPAFYTQKWIGGFEHLSRIRAW